MKNLFLIFTFVSVNLFSQESVSEPTSHKNELSIHFDDIFQRYDYPSSYYYYYDLYNSLSNEVEKPKIGFGYKRSYQNFAIRSKLSFSMIHLDNRETIDTNKSDVAHMMVGISAGIEKQYKTEKTMLFFGADLFTRYFDAHGSSESTYNGATNTSSFDSYLLGFGVSPFIGFKYFISPNLSVSSELQIMLEKTDGENTRTNGQPSNNNKTQSGFNIGLGPVGQLSIHYHF